MASKKESAKIDALEQQNKNEEANRALRDKYARWVFRYLMAYSLAVLVILIAAGFRVGGFSLPESVLDYLVGSTAAAAIGLVFAVTSGLFRPGKD